MLSARARCPVGGNAEVGENNLRGVVGWQPGDVAAGMAAGAAEIMPGQVGAIAPRSGERAVVADVIVAEGAHPQIAFAHVWQCAYDIERRAGERGDGGDATTGG